MMRRVVATAILFLVGMATALWAQTGRSGLHPGEMVEPFSSNVVTGPLRGKQHCFICDTEPDQVGLIFFVHRPDGATARLVKTFLKHVEVTTHGRCLSWTVVLGPSGSAAEDELAEEVWNFARRYAMTDVTITVLGAPEGPPGYRIAPDAAVAVILYQHLKVMLNASWPLSTWSETTADAAVTALDGQLSGLLHR